MSKKQITKEAPPIKLYLAHPLDSRHEIRKWELRFEKKFPMIQLVNPFYDRQREDIDRLDRGERTKYQGLVPEEIVTRDLGLIKDSAGIVAVIDNARYGTIMEMVYATLFNKPVYTIIGNGHEKHPWIAFHSSVVFSNLKQFEDYAKAELVDFIAEQKREESNEGKN